MSFSIACLVGTYVGIVMNTYQILGPRSADGGSYLRDVPLAQVDLIDQAKRAGQMDAERAYQALLSLVEQKK
jgi:hypothetical protein